MKLRILTGCGLALLCLACAIVSTAAWLALMGAVLAFGIGCYLNRRRCRDAGSDASHLLRILLLSGGAMTILGALGSLNGTTTWLLVGACVFPILPAYVLGYMNYLVFYTLGCFLLLGMLIASQPEKKP